MCLYSIVLIWLHYQIMFITGTKAIAYTNVAVLLLSERGDFPLQIFRPIGEQPVRTLAICLQILVHLM